MDAAVIKYYRKLLRTGFEHAGSFDNPSVFLESRGRGGVCGRAADYVQIFINISKGRVDGIKYLCTCDPTANVAIEVLCALARGKTLNEVESTSEDSFLHVVGTESEEMREKARALLKFLNEGLTKYKTKTDSE